MSGYKLRLTLYSSIETWREIEVPDNITFERLNFIIMKLFGFRNIHMWGYSIPRNNPDSDEIDLNDIVKTINMDKSYKLKLNKIFNKYKILTYEYDYGDGWEIIINKFEDTKYKNKTALITDYKGKYNPCDDMGGIFVFEEIIEAVNEGKNILNVIEDYGMGKWELREMDFEEKYEIGSRIRLNDPVRYLTL